MTAPTIAILGIRHHGPGSARAVRAALERLRPDCVLIEGPPDADALIPLCGHAEMRPPVALLVYATEDPGRSAFYPFASFSPEWSALRWAVAAGCEVRFMDAPLRHRLEVQRFHDQVGENTPTPPVPKARIDPIALLAQAAGIDDPERFWEVLVEQRQDAADVFPAILEVMSAVRAEVGEDSDPIERLREAWMRTNIRRAVAQGHQRIAVVCGAWHGPALTGDLTVHETADREVLRALPTVETAAAWVPWSQDRFASASGYGAGVESPGWYDHLWQVSDRGVERWLVRVARLLREHGLDCSSAHVIEAVRLASCVASLRDQASPRLSDIQEAVRSVFCFGAEASLALIHRELVVGTALGAVPDDSPVIPVQADLDRQCRRLRLPRETLAKTIDLDLRHDGGRDRSRLLHRLRLIGIPWGTPAAVSGKGTFKEAWTVAWKPEFVVALIAAGRLGTTVEDAAAATAAERAANVTDLPGITTILDQALLAELPQVTGPLLVRLDTLAAIASDAVALLDAIPALARTARYGDVRGTDTEAIGRILTGIVDRAAIGVPMACGSLDDEAAAAMRDRLIAVTDALITLDRPDLLDAWRGALRILADRDGFHGVVAGRAVRLLLDQQVLTQSESEVRFARALSAGADPADGAAWIEGLLAGSGTALLHDDGLFGILDRWLNGLNPDAFIAALPLIRRTSGTFAPAERRQLGERVASGPVAIRASSSDEVDLARADAALPLMARILGVEIPV